MQEESESEEEIDSLNLEGDDGAFSTQWRSYSSDQMTLTEDVWDAESNYMELLAAEVLQTYLHIVCLWLYYIKGARQRRALTEEVEDDEEEEEEEEITEDLGYISPLDTAKPYNSFKQSLTSTCSSSDVHISCHR